LEFTGQFWGRSAPSTKSTLSIAGERPQYLIRESEGTLLKTSETTGRKWDEQKFVLPFQSKLTNMVVQQLLENGICDLLSLDYSHRLHKLMRAAFLKHL